MTRSRSTSEHDLGAQLGLSGPGAWALAAVFAVTFLTVAGLSGGDPMRTPAGWIVLGLVIASAVALVLPWPDPLPLPIVLAVVGIVGVTTAVVIWRSPPTGALGWGGWNFGACTFLLFMVALRGRVGWAAVGLATVDAVTVHWSFVVTGGWERAFGLLYADVFVFGAVTFFTLLLRREAARILEFRATLRRRAAEEDTAEAAAEIRDAHLELIGKKAGPALAEIAAGTATDRSRVDHALLEAELRDQIRGRSLAIDRLPAAARAARARGVEVALLDDIRDDTLDPAFLSAAAAWAVERLETATDGEVTIRLARADGIPVVTVGSAAGAGASPSFALSPAGSPADPPAAADPHA